MTLLLVCLLASVLCSCVQAEILTLSLDNLQVYGNLNSSLNTVISFTLPVNSVVYAFESTSDTLFYFYSNAYNVQLRVYSNTRWFNYNYGVNNAVGKVHANPFVYYRSGGFIGASNTWYCQLYTANITEQTAEIAEIVDGALNIHYCSSNATACSLCPCAVVSGMTVTVPNGVCTNGYVGLTQCKCDEGYQVQAGTCTACPLGSYYNNSSCTPCPYGETTTNTASLSSTACYSLSPPSDASGVIGSAAGSVFGVIMIIVCIVIIVRRHKPTVQLIVAPVASPIVVAPGTVADPPPQYSVIEYVSSPYHPSQRPVSYNMPHYNAQFPSSLPYDAPPPPFSFSESDQQPSPQYNPLGSASPLQLDSPSPQPNQQLPPSPSAATEPPQPSSPHNESSTPAASNLIDI